METNRRPLDRRVDCNVSINLGVWCFVFHSNEPWNESYTQQMASKYVHRDSTLLSYLGIPKAEFTVKRTERNAITINKCSWSGIEISEFCGVLNALCILMICTVNHYWQRVSWSVLPLPRSVMLRDNCTCSIPCLVLSITFR